MARSIPVLASVLALVTFGSGLALAADETGRAAGAEVPAWAYQMAGELMSPFCPGVTLAECTSPQAESLRLWIIEQARQGRDAESVREMLHLQYGDQIRATPRADGFGLAAYVMPVLVFAAGGGLVGWFLRRATRKAPAREAPAPGVLDPERERRLDEVLSR